MLAQSVTEKKPIEPGSADSAALAIAKMRAAGFALKTDGDALQIAPSDRLTDEQRAYIRAHKVLLLAELRAELAPVAESFPIAPVIPVMPVVAVVDFDQDAFEERAAILEYDAGFSRDEAERRALALMSAENLLKPTVQAPPVESAVAPPLPVAKPEIVCCGDCAHSVLSPDTCPVYGWRLCGLDIEGGGGFGRAVRRCDAWEVRT